MSSAPRAKALSSRAKALGQYFTVSEDLQQFVFDHVQNKPACLLEPSFGAGHLLQKFLALDADYPMVCCELDTTVAPVVRFGAAQTVVWGDFMTAPINDRKFRTIVGNPPYVKGRQRKRNLYLDFIERCYNLLDEDGGELVFVVPADFIKLTRAAALITTMVRNGSFTDFLFPHNERLFDGAAIDVMVFRYARGAPQRTTAIVNGSPRTCCVNRGIITFAEMPTPSLHPQTTPAATPLESAFQVFVGIVSGRDDIYRNATHGNIDVLCDLGRSERFIFHTEFPTGSPATDAHLLAHKDELAGRRIRKFTEANWFEWGAPRNIGHIRRLWGSSCIYVRTVTRQPVVAFVGTVQYFGGTLLCLVPRAVMTDTELVRICDYLNSDEFKKDYMYSGRFKIGHKQVSSALIPGLV